MSSASALKERGNELFEAQSFRGAADCYAEALSLLKQQDAKGQAGESEALSVPVHLNLVACLLRLGEQLEEAVKLCDAVLTMDAANSKALFRRGSARQALARQGCSSDSSEARREQLTAARKDLVQAAKAEPQNRQVRKVLEEVTKELQSMPRQEGQALAFASGLYCDREPGGELSSAEDKAPAECSTCDRQGHVVCGKLAWIRQRAEWLGVPEEEVAKEPSNFEEDGNLREVIRAARPNGGSDESFEASLSDLSDEELDALEDCLNETSRPYPQPLRPLPLTQAVHCAEDVWAED